MFGLIDMQLQSRFPFTKHIGINEPERFAEQWKRAKLDYVKNCFTCIEHFAKAHRLLDTQVNQDWPTVLEKWAAQIAPLLCRFFGAENRGSKALAKKRHLLQTILNAVTFVENFVIFANLLLTPT